MNRFVIFLFLCFFLTTTQGQTKPSVFDSILKYRDLAEDPNLTPNEQLIYAKKAVELSQATKIDSTILLSNRKLSFVYLSLDEYTLYRDINYKNLVLATKLKDTVALAITYNNLGYYHHNNVRTDSAFFYYSKALKLYSKLKRLENEYKILQNIADIQETEKDYVGSEENAIKAIKIINLLPPSESNRDNLWALNNLIGIISAKLGNFDKAIEYHNKALDISDQMDDGRYNELLSKNNLAEVYRQKGEINASIDLYQEVIEEKDYYYAADPSFYAIALANQAYCKSLRENENIDALRGMFYEAKNISDTINDMLAQTGISIDIAKFYQNIQEKDSALYYAEKSKTLSEESSNNELLLESLEILSELTEGEQGRQYLKRHIELGERLLLDERNYRNKFARIELETDQLEAENAQISKENFYLVLLSGGLLLTAVLVYVVISQRAKNRKLKLIQVQQKANEDIYNLMLSQQDKVDEARTQEKKRISEELHDGVLGRLFGTRLSLDSINFKDGKDAMMTRANYIGQLKTIEEDIRKISHELNTDFVSGSGFMDIVSELIENQTLAYGLAYDFDYTDDISWDSVSNKTKINIYRIIQESMQNIYKHANAKAIKISISLEKTVICLDIIDDGEGFDTSKSKKGIGLKNMTSRVEDINGEISFNSQSGNGTTVNVKIPYMNQST